MANELRLRQNFLGGLIENNPLGAGDGTLQSAALASMRVVTSAEHMAIVFDPDGVFGVPEITYVTSHADGAATATLLRGQEETVARQHSRDVPWVHAITAKDLNDLTTTKGSGQDTLANQTLGTSQPDGVYFKSTMTFLPGSGIVQGLVSARGTSSGNQGMYVGARLYKVIGGVDTAIPEALVGQRYEQVVQNPLNNTLHTGSATYFVEQGITYRWEYRLGTGLGGSNVTFTEIKIDWKTY